jgi:prepilin-type N-terminal cleavage/methylation domain-containing protein
MPRAADHSGFTLIELLMVLVIIGLLASVLVPKFYNSRERAFVGAMKSDLRNLASAEEEYFYDYQNYTTTVANLAGFRTSTGVSITINQAHQGGWSATATHNNSTASCWLFVGNAAPVGSATVDGQITCN